jgi:hypothetical protein
MRSYPNCDCQFLSENISANLNAAGFLVSDQFFGLVEDEIRSGDGERIVCATTMLTVLARCVPVLRKRIDKALWVINLVVLNSIDEDVRNHARELADVLLFQMTGLVRSNWEVLLVARAHFEGMNEEASVSVKLGCLSFCRAMWECGYGELLNELINNDMAHSLLEVIEEIAPECPELDESSAIRESCDFCDAATDSLSVIVSLT